MKFENLSFKKEDNNNTSDFEKTRSKTINNLEQLLLNSYNNNNNDKLKKESTSLINNLINEENINNKSTVIESKLSNKSNHHIPLLVNKSFELLNIKDTLSRTSECNVAHVWMNDNSNDEPKILQKNSLNKNHKPKFMSKKNSKSIPSCNKQKNKLLTTNHDTIKKYSYLFVDVDSTSKSIRSKLFAKKNQRISDCDLSRLGLNNTRNKTNDNTNLLTFGGEIDTINRSSLTQEKPNILQSNVYKTNLLK